MSKKFLIISVLILFLSISSACAGDVNGTDTDSDVNEIEHECTSFVIQEENETVYAFRQDAPLNGYGVVIHNDTLGEWDIIRQEIDNPAHYFTHAVIAENGWIISQGGSQFDDDNREVERIACDMILSDNISSSSLIKIQNILKKYEYGHVLIKAPDGRYGVSYYNTYFTGVLKPGEFLTVANIYDFFRQGNYSGYAVNPVDAIVEICSYENSGWNRRNLYIYDCRAHDTPEGEKYGADIYVTNDVGYNTGLNTTAIVTYFTYNGTFYNTSDIPKMPDKLYVATYIFKNQSKRSLLKAVEKPETVGVNTTAGITYIAYNFENESSVLFELGENIEFVVAEITGGSYYLNTTTNTVIWNVSGRNNTITLKIRAKLRGTYNILSYVEGKDMESNVSFYAAENGAVLSSKNVLTYKCYSNILKIYLTDRSGGVLTGENVSVTVNGVTYVREVTSRGYAEFAVMLQPGVYDAFISYDGKFGKSNTTARITVISTLFTDDLTVKYGDASLFSIRCVDEDGNSRIITADFSVDGKLRNIYTNKDGVYNLDISKLQPGTHYITTYNLATNEFRTNTVIITNDTEKSEVKKTTPKLTAKAKTFRLKTKSKKYSVILKDNTGKAIKNAKITLKVKGKTYTARTNINGKATFKITKLTRKGKYTAYVTFKATGSFNKVTKKVKITVKK